MGKTVFVLAAAFALVCAGSASAFWGRTYVNEDFESYAVTYPTPVADGTNVLAPTAWGMDMGTIAYANNWYLVGPNSPNPAATSKTAMADGGRTLRHNFGTHIFPDDAHPLVVQLDVYDLKGTTTLSMAAGMALADNRYSVDPLGHVMQMSATTLASSQLDGGGANPQPHYGFRAISMNGTYPGVAGSIVSGHAGLPDAEAKIAPMWVRMRMEIGDTKIYYYVDRGIDGTWDNNDPQHGLTGATYINIAPTSFAGWYQVQLGTLGGSAGYASAQYDNVLVYHQPEPVTMVLLALGGLLMRSRRH